MEPWARWEKYGLAVCGTLFAVFVAGFAYLVFLALTGHSLSG